MPEPTLSRRNFLKYSSALSVGAGILSLTHCNFAPKQPNIIFLLTDDQRWDTLGAAGNPHIHTPNMDQLAKDGVLFQNAFVTTAICAVSRASIFLGQYARRHGINDFDIDFTSSQLNHTYPLLLKQSGYRIGFIGKYGVGQTMPEAQYDFWRGMDGQPKYETTDEQGNPIHCTRLFGNQALEFINTSSPKQPFCLSISFKAPHVQDGDPRQFIPDPAYDDLYQDAIMPPPVNADDAIRESLPDFLKSEQNMTRKRWRLRFENPELYQKSIKNYYRLISGVDAELGRIQKTLKENGLDENTMIVLLGDNGFFLGEYGFAGKWYGHEPSIRVPLIIYDPRLKQSLRNQKRDELALNIDMAPTFLEAAGVPIPESMQGQSLMPLLYGNTPKWRQDFLYEHVYHVPAQWRSAVGNIPASVGVRTEKHKYLRYFEEEPVYEQLFDLEQDPQETNNLVFSKSHQSILNTLRKRCDALLAKNK